jgi:hypothetical protein
MLAMIPRMQIPPYTMLTSLFAKEISVIRIEGLNVNTTKKFRPNNETTITEIDINLL